MSDADSLSQAPALGGANGPSENLPRLGGDAAFSHLLEALQDGDTTIRERAAEALGDLTDERAIALLLGALQDQTASVRARAARALGRTGAGDHAVISALLGALHDPSELVRQSAAEALGQTGDAGAVEALLDALYDPGVGVRQRAAETLGIIAARPGNDMLRIRIINGLLAAMRATSYLLYLTVVRSIAAALVRIGEPAVPDLLAALRENSARVSTAAAEVLAQLYPTLSDQVLRKGIILALVETAAGAEPFVSLTAIRSLASLEVEEAALRDRVVNTILKLFRETEVDADQAVVSLLRRWSSPRGVGPVVPQGGQYVRPDIAEALGRLGAQHPKVAEQVAPELIKAVDDPSPEVRRAAITAIGAIGETHPSAVSGAVPALARRLGDSSSRLFSPDARVGDLAAAALRRIGTPEALQALERAS